MSRIANTLASPPKENAIARRPVAEWLAPLEDLATAASSLVTKPIGGFEHAGERYEIPRYIFVGNRPGGTAIRLGIFAGIHGDEPEGVHALVRLAQVLESKPELGAGYCLFLYPTCNPTGLEDHTRQSRSGKDLNREFWRSTHEPEVRLLQAELVSQSFDGIISLHTDEQSHGFYGFARGATLTKHLLRPALAAAAELLPINHDERIDEFEAKEGMIEDCYEGVLSAPAKVRPKPFEIILETPGQAPSYLREAALVVSLCAILAEYRKFIAYAPNL